MLAGLLPPAGGSIEFNGHTGSQASVETRRAIGVVPQDLAIYSKLTGRENLEFFGSLYGLSGAVLADRVKSMLELVGLSDRAGSLADSYSGGMKRRLNLAAGLMHDPKLLLLDEPTVGVDPQSRNHIFEGVRELNRRGLTVLYTSHYMEEVEALCDRVGIMDNGQLVACDTVNHLIASLGGSTIEIGLMPGISAPDDVLDEIRRLDHVREVAATMASDDEADAPVLNVRADNPELAVAGIVQALVKHHVQFQRLDVKRPDLEDVFLSLTGKSLRD